MPFKAGLTVLSAFYDHKTIEFDFCTCTPKLSNRNSIFYLIQLVLIDCLFFLVPIQTRAHRSYDCNIISLILYINMHSCELDSSPLEGVLDKTLCREVCQKVYGFLMVLVS